MSEADRGVLLRPDEIAALRQRFVLLRVSEERFRRLLESATSERKVTLNLDSASLGSDRR